MQNAPVTLLSKRIRWSARHKRGKHSKKCLTTTDQVAAFLKTSPSHLAEESIEKNVDDDFFACLQANYFMYDFGTDWCADPIADYVFGCYINSLNKSEKNEWWRMFLNDAVLAKRYRKKLESSIEDAYSKLEENFEVDLEQNDDFLIDEERFIDENEEHDDSSEHDDEHED
jgi:hypothetical protein